MNKNGKIKQIGVDIQNVCILIYQYESFVVLMQVRTFSEIRLLFHSKYHSYLKKTPIFAMRNFIVFTEIY